MRVHAQVGCVTLRRSAGCCRCVQAAAGTGRQVGCKKVRLQGFNASCACQLSTVTSCEGGTLLQYGLGTGHQLGQLCQISSE